MPSATAATPKQDGSVRAPSVNSTRKAENAYPPPRDRRLSRKTRAAVGKPPGSTNAVCAVSTADNPDAVAMPIGHWEAAETVAAAVADHKKLAQHRPCSIPHCLSQPG